MEILVLVLRTIFIYFIVFFILRIMGKREIGKLSVFDLVISIMIAEIAVFVLEDTKKPMIEGIVPMATLVVVQILIAYVTLKSQKIRRLFDGNPSVIIENGKLNRNEMKKQRYNLDDLMLQLRQNNVTNVSDVEFAILEPTGKLTVIQKRDMENNFGKSTGGHVTGNSEHRNIRYEGLPLPLIMDGKVQDENLQKIGKTRFWLKNQIQTQGVADFKEIFICTVDHRGRLFVDKKNPR